MLSNAFPKALRLPLLSAVILGIAIADVMLDTLLSIAYPCTERNDGMKDLGISAHCAVS